MRRIETIVDDMQAGGLCCDPLSTTTVVAYEAGAVVQNSFYALVRASDTQKGQVAYLSTEMADLVMQLRVLCHWWGIDFTSLADLGEERVYDTIEKLKQRGVNPQQELWRNIQGIPPFDVERTAVVAGTQTGRVSYANPPVANAVSWDEIAKEEALRHVHESNRRLGGD